MNEQLIMTRIELLEDRVSTMSKTIDALLENNKVQHQTIDNLIETNRHLMDSIDVLSNKVEVLQVQNRLYC